MEEEKSEITKNSLDKCSQISKNKVQGKKNTKTLVNYKKKVQEENKTNISQLYKNKVQEKIICTVVTHMKTKSN
jgi:hypothetical protein